MAKELVKSEQDHDLMFDEHDIMLLMMVFVMIAMMTQISSTLNNHVSAQQYQGRQDPRVLTATINLQHIDLVNNDPHTPWIYASIINDGPSDVEIGINYPDARTTVNVGEVSIVDRTNASERISVIFYKGVGGSAHLRVNGEY